ncbi:MAG: 2Fe-2S iron-sulfur cluster binding domain-containing protein [Treponema sp.]|jgi:ferredoxin|nr:2Fe-2S iron-sulfur cluster binding domain-containing protein [Treponema sp.]
MEKYLITVEDTGQKFYCAGDQAVLRAMFHAGTGPLHYGCCGGGCGICKMRIVSGTWDAFKPMSRAYISGENEKRGVVLLCCVKPRSDMVIARVL